VHQTYRHGSFLEGKNDETSGYRSAFLVKNEPQKENQKWFFENGLRLSLDTAILKWHLVNLILEFGLK